jgi:hypothetical protein
MTPPPPSLAATLTELAEVADAMTAAVERHDLAALQASTERADALTQQARALTGERRPADAASAGPSAAGPAPVATVTPELQAVGERLAAAARRNAYLIEHAWAVDAATMRLIAGLASGGSPASGGGSGSGGDGTARTGAVPAAYAKTGPAIAYLEREA